MFIIQYTVSLLWIDKQRSDTIKTSIPNNPHTFPLLYQDQAWAFLFHIED